VNTIASTLTESLPAWTNSERQFMARALELARRGTALVSPGPMVGCVIVDPAGVVVGEGFYLFEEVRHAETIALSVAGDKARGGTAYVSLEPHAHHGRTAPCTDALIAAGIKRVVASIEDSNPKVSGRGFEHLRNAGLEVEVGLLAEDAARVNEAYIHYMRTSRPFVHLKMAVSLDGKIATRTGDSRWVTGPESRARAHELRHQYDAIMIGIGTAAKDDPLLTDRSDSPRRLQLVRIVLDEQLLLPAQSRLVQTVNDAPVIVIAGTGADEARVQELESRGVEIVRKDNRDPFDVLDELGRRSVQSVLLEGGSGIAGRFIDAGLVNKVTFFVAPKIVGGSEAPSAVGGTGVALMKDALQLEDVVVTQRGNDIEVTGYPRAGKE
jgi:diaminohydroxyphosphoribosylaminopyrimidine deaminase/5-amino-6-(5-phosphoribosylamino)uracil reductase